MPSASKEGVPCLLEGVVIEGKGWFGCSYKTADGWVGHKGVLVLTHTDSCLNSGSLNQLSDKHIVPSALVHRAFCDLESIHEQLESLKSSSRDDP